ncbi:helix-turn-helix domain-containing protein [Lipingzhangella sp. LS1_29]|uniref:Helix-turn-helix domain-containing protein n=1 Tax=Lipingzhangella rawalii TaxID=2055835 RepID=A0ABU2H2J5_9ACTN|nr:helix-turn-helix domain-containing protein [Lipingzhangella rawalii]MDS1269513.1 helix-turn-helix domain-containing protein [Lipingzhangella rawalii]
MTLRIHFTTDDLLRIRLADQPEPQWELVNSAHLLQNRDGHLVFGTWRGEMRSRVLASSQARTTLDLLTRLAPCSTYFPDFLSPLAEHPDPPAGIERVLATPGDQLHREVTLLFGGNQPPGWFNGLARAESGALRALGMLLDQYQRWALLPWWETITTAVGRDLHYRRQALVRGTEELLASFAPLMRWHRPVLEVRGYPVRRELHLRGRGLLLAPSYFCWRQPVTYADPEQPPVLIYPIDRSELWQRELEHRSTPGTELGCLLGGTRARILELITEHGETTTTGLAHSAGISPAAASKHTAVLRESGLVTTQRHGKQARHQVTPLGAQLLRGSGPERRPPLPLRDYV